LVAAPYSNSPANTMMMTADTHRHGCRRGTASMGGGGEVSAVTIS
jgi:hypothetical protein